MPVTEPSSQWLPNGLGQRGSTVKVGAVAGAAASAMSDTAASEIERRVRMAQQYTPAREGLRHAEEQAFVLRRR